MIYLVLLVALIVRLVLINQSFWLDEAASLTISRLPINDLFSALKNDFHPPAYYLFLHFWLEFGITNEWFLRLPGVVFGTASVWFLYKLLQLIKTKSSHNLPLIASLLLAINPLHIYYSQELRMYSLNILLSVITWYLLVKSTKNKSKILPFLFSFLTLLNLYTFYGAVFNLIAQFVYLFANQRQLLKIYTIHALFYPLFFVPWAPTFMDQLKGGEYLQTQLPNWKMLSGDLSVKSLLLIPLKFSLGRINLSTNSLYLLTAASTSLYFASLILLGLKHKLAKIFAIWLIIPILLALILALKTPILGYWRYLYLLPAFVSLIALGISLLPKKLMLLNLVVVVITLLMANSLFWTHPNSWREDWRGAANFVSDYDQQTTVTIFAFPDAFAPIRWYASDLNYKAPLTDLNSDPEKLDLSMSSATINKDTVLLFNYLTPLTDPGGNIITWLDNAGFTLANTYNFSGVGFIYEYSAPQSQ